MAQTRFCPKCGSSLIAGADRCRNCYTPIDPANAVVASASAGSRPDGNPFVDMWLHPRETIRGILDNNATYLVVPIAAVGGVSQALGRLADRNAADILSLPVLLVMAFTIGPLGGIFSLYVFGALVTWSGRWIGGEASAQDVRASIAWGSVPALWGAMLWIPAIALTGAALFHREIPDTVNPFLVLTASALLLVQVGTSLWSFITGLKSLSEVQGFSTWRALGNICLAGAVIVVPIMILMIGAIVLALALGGRR